MKAIERARWRLLVTVTRAVEPLMALLGLAWLLLLVIEFAAGLSPLLLGVSRVIWAAFVVDFSAQLAIAPDRRLYVRRNWLVLLTSERAHIADPRVRRLADRIIESQRREIDEMKSLIHDLEAGR